ncbi:GrpB family protein [Paenactinomyces guangxiensis]|uniref:GrpB family protein n=2 Tax=Paenactinomyces guangxiensis TaxID=1490290 RepID=A0A7W1WQ79_9BACL|nr:GrpB family protein [Paenactinomyces guangxiensis]MBA4494025.1 GrpB family protein [Paenactinomyces guangxiensis]MBH8591230.1 GrpB family protein [Paenactinomyces guangxiensis]
MREVTVVPYDPYWNVLYEREAGRLKQVLGSCLIGLYHIGSTSVPGLAAKPVIDLMPVVKQIEWVDSLNEQMARLGYIAKGENGIPGRRYFYKGETVRTHHVHIFAAGNPEISRHLAFRDYLRTHPEEAKSYGELKLKLAQQFPFDIQSYMDGKDSLVKELEKKALRWQQEKS